MRFPIRQLLRIPTTLPAGTTMYRCHMRGFPGSGFHFSLNSTSRFTPLISQFGKGTETLYAAETFGVAVYETVFRLAEYPAAGIPRSEIQRICMSQIGLRRRLLLVPLFTPELKKWRLRESAIFAPDDSVYPICRKLAMLIWRDNPWADGIVWRSVQDSKSNAILLFGERCGGEALFVIKTQAIESDGEFLDQAVEAGERAGISIG